MVLIKVLLSNGLCGNTIKDLDGFFCPLKCSTKFYNLPFNGKTFKQIDAAKYAQEGTLPEIVQREFGEEE
ncbi:hypothetical protein LG101_13880 [Levilactobacillus brevis]|nr:hypothetical protein LG101_13880 [Levilactobacillus brevis]